MAVWRVMLSRLKSLGRRSRQDEELREELDGYVGELAARHERAGLPPGAARRQALIDVEGIAQVEDRVRGVRVGSSIESLWRDVRHGLRLLGRAPAHTAALVLVLALGIGANGAVFSIVRAVLLQPLPYRNPSRVVMVWTAPLRPQPPHDLLHPSVPYRPPTGDEAQSIHAHALDALADSATYRSWQADPDAQFDLGLRDRAERLRGVLATPNFFDVLGVHAAIGRVFTAADASTSDLVVVLSDALWRRDFAGDPSIVGRAVTLVGEQPRVPRGYTVLGVLPAAFRFTYPEDTEIFALYRWRELDKGRGGAGYWTVARLRPGVTLAAAQARVAAIPTLEVERHLPIESQTRFALQPIAESVIGQTRPAMFLLGGVALLLLLITCATVASALFVRMTERRRELAVREALGAGRPRLVRQLLTEGVVLAAAGAAGGTLLAMLATPALRALIPPTLPRGDEIAVNVWILGFLAAAAGLTTILATLMPAWWGARFDVASTLKRSATPVSADRSSVRWRGGLVAAQTGIATALLLTSALLLASFWRLSHVPLGFDGSHVVTVEMRLLGPKYQAVRHPGPPPTFTPSSALVSFQDRLLADARALPGVVDVGLTSAVPFRGTDYVYVLNRVGRKATVAGNARIVDPGYFSVLEIPVLRGRVFDETDTATSSPVIVISESYARRMFGDENPLGQLIEDQPTRQVIGVVGDMRYKAYGDEPYPAVYIPRSQSPNGLICMVARTAPNAGDLGPALRALINGLDPDVPAMNLTTIDQIEQDSVADRRFYTTATTAFALLALALTLTGIAVVVSRAVVERRRELAIRAALGATAGRLIRLGMAQGLPAVLAGMVLGLAAAFSAARLLQPFLYDVAPHATTAYASVAVLVLGVAVAAAFIPARRAGRTPPGSILRAE